MIVLESTALVVEKARHVSIDDSAIDRWAQTVSAPELRPQAFDLLKYLPGSREQIANLILLIDSLNFCFWSADPIRIEWRGKTYERFNAMLVSLILAAKYEPNWFEAQYWVEAPSEEIQQVLSGKGELLLMPEREQIIRETGRTLLDRFQGEFINAVESVNEKAWPLAVLLMTNFDSFRDVSRYGQSPIYIMKRAQITALDLSLAWDMAGFGGLGGLEELTAFADYRIPQSLRHLGILTFSPELAERIEQEDEIVAESVEEVEIRAASIHAVERMRLAANAVDKNAAPWQIDCYLWELSHCDEIGVNHHRTRTVYY